MTKDGGPAFPVTTSPAKLVESTGMSLRDYFAANALSVLGSGQIVEAMHAEAKTAGAEPSDYLARFVYAIADALLVEREKRS